MSYRRKRELDQNIVHDVYKAIDRTPGLMFREIADELGIPVCDVARSVIQLVRVEKLVGVYKDGDKTVVRPLEVNEIDISFEEVIE